VRKWESEKERKKEGKKERKKEERERESKIERRERKFRVKIQRDLSPLQILLMCPCQSIR